MKTVEQNVRIPITEWIVKISATVMRTDVISQPDVQILQKVLHHLVHYWLLITNFQMIRTVLFIELLIFDDESLPI